ncbi:hypothetical protein M472_16175 [Sphingobacterium paucimobilis HER1398]|uniref:Uncharacterized protein n=1 Tax=Sphingobacterium paucimobilis HER1398 TaxID=1346330 RepID=U2HEV4_9SPHI|nr:hypothetical protein M472_03605 [Sphingobacterium paucimobilis HER1398]ERJ60296.1 hypothetical protein M472_16175 [Sphingobacterium paucimobilis HER1398]
MRIYLYTQRYDKVYALKIIFFKKNINDMGYPSKGTFQKMEKSIYY